MNEYSKIPYHWFSYQNTPCYYVTYWGDIYVGTLWEIPSYEKGFFIVANHNVRELNELRSDEKTPERYRSLGWEINDYRVIKKIVASGNGLKFSGRGPNGIGFSGEKFTKAFVFGAGASTFCCFGDHANEFKEDPLHPPIGYEIFHERYDSICQKYEGLRFSIPDFEAKGNNIEESLEIEWQKYSTTYNPQIAIRHINIQYYLSELFETVSRHVKDRYYRKNLYSLFSAKIQSYCSNRKYERLLMISFNYDTILENFIQGAFGYSYRTIDDYMDWANRSVIIFKPHGSSNWGWRFPEKSLMGMDSDDISAWLYQEKKVPSDIFYDMLGTLESLVYEGSYGLEMSRNGSKLGRLGINKQLIEVMGRDKRQSYYPAMLLPYRDKDEFVMPYDHATALEHAVGEVEQLFLIGWKGNEELFNRKLKQRLSKCKELIVVNPDPESVLTNLKDVIANKSIAITKIETFEEFVLHHLDNYLEQ